jgi:Spy/CpxP family protein refolding chaperone
MSSLIRLSFLTALLVSAASAPALAEEHSDPFEGMQNPKRLLRGAMLTEAQLVQIRELRRSQWEQEKELQAKLKAIWEQFDDKFTSTEPLDQAALISLYERGQELQAQSEHAKLLVMIQMRALLAPDQLARVSEAHQKTKLLNGQLRELPATVAAESGR